MKRILILAEGYSGDPHYGKTARGVIRYGPDPVVALLDSERAGETQDGIPIVGTVDDALRFDPTHALVGVATQGGRFPPAWRELLRSCIANGLHVVSGLHEFMGDDPELADLAARHGVTLTDLRRPPEDLNVPTGENLTHGARVVHTVGSDCAIGKKTMALELDHEARRSGPAPGVVPPRRAGGGGARRGAAAGAAPGAGAAGEGGPPRPPAPATPGARGDLRGGVPARAARARGRNRAQPRRPRRGRGARRRRR